MAKAKRPPKPPKTLLLPLDEARIVTLRAKLKKIHGMLDLIHDVVIVCARACREARTDMTFEVDHILRSVAADQLFGEMKELSFIIRQLGGETDLMAGLEDDDE